MANTIPYIGSKISLISNSEIRYEGILYTINTQESTIALQSVKTFGTEGRKIPEIPPSSEIYDFIIFRGQDIKDLTVLEGAQGQSSPMLSDPAIMSMNQRPAGGGKGGGKDSQKGGGKGDRYKGDYQERSSGWGDRGKGDGKGGGNAWGKGGDYGWGKGDGWGKGASQWDSGKGGGYGKGGGKGKFEGGGKGKDYYAADKGGSGYKGGKDSYKGGGKNDGKGSMNKGKAAKGDGGYGKGKSDGKGYGKDRDGKGYGKDRGNRPKGGAATASGAPVGELVPEANADVKRECAADFDVDAANTKFEKVTDEGDKAKPLSGYNKVSSFFDNISCEATDRAAESERPKVDREKARQYDRDTFGDTRRPPRPVGARRAKGKGFGKGS